MTQQRRTQGPMLRFTKMHGLGNDFMVVDAISQPFRLRPEMIRELANRNFGIGFDQLLVVDRRPFRSPPTVERMSTPWMWTARQWN